MNVDSILISDYADVNGGKLNVIGVFNSIGARSFPARHPLLSISVVVHGHADEAGTRHTMEIRPINSRREPFGDAMEVEFQFTDGPPPEGVPLRYMFARRILGVIFPAPGPYAFEIYIDGTYHASTVLLVGQVE